MAEQFRTQDDQEGGAVPEWAETRTPLPGGGQRIISTHTPTGRVVETIIQGTLPPLVTVIREGTQPAQLAGEAQGSEDASQTFTVPAEGTGTGHWPGQGVGASAVTPLGPNTRLGGNPPIGGTPEAPQE